MESRQDGESFSRRTVVYMLVIFWKGGRKGQEHAYWQTAATTKEKWSITSLKPHAVTSKMLPSHLPVDFTSTIFTATAAKKDTTTSSQDNSRPAKENSALWNGRKAQTNMYMLKDLTLTANSQAKVDDDWLRQAAGPFWRIRGTL